MYHTFQYYNISTNMHILLERWLLVVNVVLLNCCGVCLNPPQEVRDQVIEEAATWPQVRLQLMFESRECQYIFIENVICKMYGIQNPQQEYLLSKSAVSKKCVIIEWEWGAFIYSHRHVNENALGDWGVALVVPSIRCDTGCHLCMSLRNFLKI